MDCMAWHSEQHWLVGGGRFFRCIYSGTHIVGRIFFLFLFMLYEEMVHISLMFATTVQLDLLGMGEDNLMNLSKTPQLVLTKTA